MVPLSEISPIGFGAFKIGRNQGIKYADGYALPDMAETERLLNGVLDSGINHVDTAPAYGLSEERIGRCIAHRRDEYILSTKVGERFEDGQSHYDFSREGMEASIAQSLRHLRADVVDIVFLHASRDDVRVLDETPAAEVLEAMKARGLTRAIGFSGYTPEGFRKALPWSDAIMVAYHPEDASLEGVIAEAGGQGTSVIVKKGLASGKLPAADAIRFCLDNQGVTSVTVGSLSLEHMQANLSAARAVRPVSR